MFLQNQPRSVWMIPNALFKCNSHCFSVFWPGCHDTQRLLYFVTHSFCGSAQSPTGPIVLVPFPCAAPPLQCIAMVSYTVLLPQLMCKSSPDTRAPCQGVTSFHCLCCSLLHIAVPQSCQARLKCRQMSTPQDQFPRAAPLMTVPSLPAIVEAPLMTVPPSLLLPSASASLPICLPLLRLWHRVKCPPLKTTSHEWRQLRF